MDTNPDVIEIDVKRIFDAIRRKVILIIAVALASGLVTFLASYIFLTPMYASNAQLFINVNMSSSNGIYEFEQSSGLMLNCVELIKSKPILDQVIQQLRLPIEYKELIKNIKIENTKDTRLLTITVRYEDPSMAQKIAGTLISICCDRISEIMNISRPEIVQEATYDDDKISPDIVKNTLVLMVIGLIGSLGIVVLTSVMNNRIISSEDVKKYLGLNTLITIPDEGEGHEERYHYREDKKKEKRSIR